MKGKQFARDPDSSVVELRCSLTAAKIEWVLSCWESRPCFEAQDADSGVVSGYTFTRQGACWCWSKGNCNAAVLISILGAQQANTHNNGWRVYRTRMNAILYY
jgi:hypothetical protein